MPVTRPFAFLLGLCLTLTAWAAPSGVLDEKGGTVGPDGKYYMVDPPLEAAARAAGKSTRPTDDGAPAVDSDTPDGENGPGDTPAPPPVSRGLTRAQIRDLHQTIIEYWGYRINEEWRDGYLIETVSLGEKVTEKEYAEGATIEPWFGRYTQGDVTTPTDIESLGDGAYRVSYTITQETGGLGEEKRTEVLAEIVDRWKLIDGRWYHMPDEFVKKVLEKAGKAANEKTPQE